MGYLSALQSMNRVILNPLFYIAFGLPIISLLLSLIFGYSPMPSQTFRLVFLASVLYIVGAFLVTLFGNIPLNNILDSIDLASISVQDAEKLRNNIEVNWNNFNLIRTLSSLIAFILLLAACFLETYF